MRQIKFYEEDKKMKIPLPPLQRLKINYTTPHKTEISCKDVKCCDVTVMCVSYKVKFHSKSNKQAQQLNEYPHTIIHLIKGNFSVLKIQFQYIFIMEYIKAKQVKEKLCFLFF